jgi:hypothetical protein
MVESTTVPDDPYDGTTLAVTMQVPPASTAARAALLERDDRRRKPHGATQRAELQSPGARNGPSLTTAGNPDIGKRCHERARLRCCKPRLDPNHAAAGSRDPCPLRAPPREVHLAGANVRMDATVAASYIHENPPQIASVEWRAETSKLSLRGFRVLWGPLRRQGHLVGSGRGHAAGEQLHSGHPRWHRKSYLMRRSRFHPKRGLSLLRSCSRAWRTGRARTGPRPGLKNATHASRRLTPASIVRSRFRDLNSRPAVYEGRAAAGRGFPQNSGTTDFFGECWRILRESRGTVSTP